VNIMPIGQSSAVHSSGTLIDGTPATLASGVKGAYRQSRWQVVVGIGRIRVELAQLDRGRCQRRSQQHVVAAEKPPEHPAELAPQCECTRELDRRQAFAASHQLEVTPLDRFRTNRPTREGGEPRQLFRERHAQQGGDDRQQAVTPVVGRCELDVVAETAEQGCGLGERLRAARVDRKALRRAIADGDTQPARGRARRFETGSTQRRSAVRRARIEAGDQVEHQCAVADAARDHVV
jgi:hypothetical protein